MSIALNLNCAGGCPAFLRTYWTRPKKAGQFPPLRKFVLSSSNHVYGMNASSSLFVMGGGNSPIFSSHVHSTSCFLWALRTENLLTGEIRHRLDDVSLLRFFRSQNRGRRTSFALMASVTGQSPSLPPKPLPICDRCRGR